MRPPGSRVSATLMPPQSRPWLLPVACAVLGVVWVIWLARGGQLAEDEAFERASPAQSPAPQSPPPQREPTTAPQDPARTHSESPKAGVAPRGPRVTEGPPPIEPALQLAILAPTSASIGEGFDMRVTIAARKAVGRIVVEIAYDPILLKARSTEEIDSTGRPPGERAFSIERMSDGQIAVVMPAQGDAAGQ
jgi:hypothetical protein